MREDILSCARPRLEYSLRYWKECNTAKFALRPVPFKKVAKAALSSQASSAAAERLFSDLGRYEGRARYSTMTSPLEMTNTIRALVLSHLRNSMDLQTGLFHPQGVVFNCL